MSIIQKYINILLFIENGISKNIMYEHVINRQHSENMNSYKYTLLLRIMTNTRFNSFYIVHYMN